MTRKLPLLIGPADTDRWLLWLAPFISAAVDSKAPRTKPSIKGARGAKRGSLGAAGMRGRAMGKTG